MLCIPAGAQNTGVKSDSEKEYRAGVEIAGEAAVIIDGKKITLSEAIKKAIELNPDIYVAKFDAAMSDTQDMKFNAQYSPFLSVQAGISSYKYPELMYNNNGKQNDSVKGSISLAKKFSTGTTVAAGFSHTSSDLDTGKGIVYNDITGPSVFATIEQELLKNCFGYGDRRQKKILKNISEAQKEARLYSMSLIALVVVTDYWNVVIAGNRLDNAKLMLAETKKVRKIVSDKVSIGLSEKFEINYWNSLVASSKAAVSQAEQNYRNKMRKFLRDINSEGNITIQEKVILSDSLPVINTEEAIKRAMVKRVDYTNAVRDLENAKLAMEIYENNSLPSLKGSLTVSSMDYNYESADAAYSNVKEGKYRSYEAKISMTHPLDDTGQKADERNAVWAVEQCRKKLEAAGKYVKDDVITKIENINTNHSLYQNAKEARKEAETYYYTMLVNMRRGRFTASTIRDAISALISCREAELQMLVVYNASLLEFEVAKNELFEAYKIDINKFLPEK
jgi:outer membrane protein TolC